MSESAITQEQYLEASGLKCPRCESLRIEADEISSEAPNRSVGQVRCYECNSTWKDEYKLVGFKDLQTPEADVP